MGFLLYGGWLSGTIVYGTLGSDGVSGVSVGAGDRELVIISCNALINPSCLSPKENGDAGYGVFNASARYLIARQVASVE